MKQNVFPRINEKIQNCDKSEVIETKQKQCVVSVRLDFILSTNHDFSIDNILFKNFDTFEFFIKFTTGQNQY